MPGALGPVGEGVLFEALHADWPAYPGDRSWEHALLRLGDFPIGTEFSCLEVVDQAVLFVARVGIRESDLHSDKHMHVAVRLDELLALDERGLVEGIQLESILSPNQIALKRTFGRDMWEQLQSGELVLGRKVDDVFVPFEFRIDQEILDDESEIEIYPPPRSPERVAMYAGTVISLSAAAGAELERIGRLALEIPPSLQERLLKLLDVGLFDSAIRDAGAALEMRMREFTGCDDFGQQLVEKYTSALLATGKYYPARLKSLRQELRSIYKFIRNEFAHNLRDLEPGRGYALLSRLCWHVSDVESVLHSQPR